MHRAIARGMRKVRARLKSQRRHFRFDCKLPVEIHVDMPGQVSVVHAVAHNISSGGMLIRCSSVVGALPQCHLSFRLPEWFPSVHRAHEIMTGVAVRHTDPSGHFFGVAFSRPI